jgi:hypothetical protein
VSDNEQSWYRLVVETVGLMATANLDQPFDFDRACRLCGAGSVPRAPLFIDATRMGKKALDATAHDHRIVVARSLGDYLYELGLSGFELRPVAHKTETQLRVEERFVWLEPRFEWPPIERSSIVAREDQCPVCSRSGHFDSPSPPTQLHYSGVPVDAVDFGATYEYFGRWRAPGKSGPNVGGGRLMIVSDQFREALHARKVRHVSFEQVVFVRRDEGASR